VGLAACAGSGARRGALDAIDAKEGGDGDRGATSAAEPPAATTPDAPFRQTAPPGAAARSYVPPRVREGRLKNGVRVVLAEDRRLALVALCVVVTRGAAAAKPSIASLALHSLYGGTQVRNRSHIADALQQAGAVGSAGIDHSAMYFSYTVLPSSTRDILSLIAELMQRPKLSVDEFQRDRSLLTAAAADQTPQDKMDSAVAGALYPLGHPYRVKADGDVLSLGHARLADVAAFLQSNLTPDQVVVVAAGNVSWDELHAHVLRAFGSWIATASPETALPEIKASPESPIALIGRKGATQTEIRVVALSPPIDSPDRLPFLLLTTALGGTFTSRINLNLRERHGYGYSPHADVQTERGPGAFSAVATVIEARTGASLKEMLAEIERARVTDLSNEELEIAKQDLLRGVPQRFSTTRATSVTLANLAANGRPLEEFKSLASDLRAIGAAEVRAVADKYLPRSKLRVVMMGDADKVLPQLAGQSVEIVLTDL
jgi:predicted Zn-dependent peptidase